MDNENSWQVEKEKESEEQIYERMFKNIGFLNEFSVNEILMRIISRKRFHYRFRDIVLFLFNCLCLRKRRDLKDTEVLKKHYYFTKA